MSDASLSVELTAKLDDLRGGLRSVIKEVEGFDKQSAASLKHVETRFNNLNDKLIGRTSDALKGLANEAKTSLGGTMPGATNRATEALLNLGRVAQDAPYGFIGIANNLNPLLESFQRLRQEAGSNVGALKALGTSLIGGGGLGLALSGVTAALSFAQIGFTMWNKGARDAKNETDGFADSIESLSKATSSGLAKMSVLYEATQNLNIPLKERKKLVSEMQEQYPSYFANFTTEEILAGKAARAYDNLKNAMINAAIVKASEELIAAKVKPLTELIVATDLAAAKFKEQTKGGIVATGNGFVLDESGDLQNIRDYKKKINDEVKATQNAISGILSQFDASTILGDPGGNKDKGNKDNGTKEKIRSVSDILKELSLNLQKVENDMTITFGDVTGKKIDSIQDAINKLQDIGIKPASETIKGLKSDIQALSSEPLKIQSVGITQANTELLALKETVKDVSISVPAMSKDMADLLATQNRIISDSFVTAFGDIGEAIGELAANGGNALDIFGGAVLGSIGGILQQFGKMTIAAGVASTALGKALTNPLNPGSGPAAIAAGAALVAIGAMVKGFSGKLGGGGSYSSSNAMQITGGYAVPGRSLPNGNRLASMSSRQEYNPVFKVINKTSMGEFVTEIEREQSRRNRVR